MRQAHLAPEWGACSLKGLRYRKKTLNIRLTGSGSTISSFKINGTESDKHFVDCRGTEEQNLSITLTEKKKTAAPARPSRPAVDRSAVEAEKLYRTARDAERMGQRGVARGHVADSVGSESDLVWLLGTKGAPQTAQDRHVILTTQATPRLVRCHRSCPMLQAIRRRAT